MAGFQARDRKDPSKENHTQVLDDLIRLINPTEYLRVIGVYVPNDPGAADEHAKNGKYASSGKLWEKGMSVGTGQIPVKAFHIMLRDMIIGGQAKPGFIVSRRISFDEIPDAYREFDQRANGYTKVISNLKCEIFKSRGVENTILKVLSEIHYKKTTAMALLSNVSHFG